MEVTKAIELYNQLILLGLPAIYVKNFEGSETVYLQGVGYEYPQFMFKLNELVRFEFNERGIIKPE